MRRRLEIPPLTRGSRGGSGAAEGGVPRLGGGQPQDGAPLLGPLALAQRQTVLWSQVEAKFGLFKIVNL